MTEEAERVHREARFGHACLSKPYSLAALNAAVAIVGDIAVDCGSSHALPQGMTLLLKAKMNTAHVTRHVFLQAAAANGGRGSTRVASRVPCEANQPADL